MVWSPITILDMYSVDVDGAAARAGGAKLVLHDIAMRCAVFVAARSGDGAGESPHVTTCGAAVSARLELAPCIACERCNASFADSLCVGLSLRLCLTPGCAGRIAGRIAGLAGRETGPTHAPVCILSGRGARVQVIAHSCWFFSLGWQEQTKWRLAYYSGDCYIFIHFLDLSFLLA